jgi:hypothetical protein
MKRTILIRGIANPPLKRRRIPKFHIARFSRQEARKLLQALLRMRGNRGVRVIIEDR